LLLVNRQLKFEDDFKTKINPNNNNNKRKSLAIVYIDGQFFDSMIVSNEHLFKMIAMRQIMHIFLSWFNIFRYMCLSHATTFWFLEVNYVDECRSS
jgi:hypothetical protein